MSKHIFLDSSDLKEIKSWNKTGIIDGVTSNQAIMLKDGVKPKQFEKLVQAICEEMGEKPVSIELSNSRAGVADMVNEAKRLNSLADNVVVKVPLIPDTKKSALVIARLLKAKIAVNVTCLMTFEQMIISALAIKNSQKPSFISLFWGRSIEDEANYRSRSEFIIEHGRVGVGSWVNQHPKFITQEIIKFLNSNDNENIKIIIGSVRSATMVGEAFAAGTDIVTIVPDILQAMFYSQRTVETIKQFDEAWEQLQKQK